MASAIDPDELARLEDERDFLLRSIDDLEREKAAGDIDDTDFAELREGYVARAAAVLHEINDRHAGLERQHSERVAADTGRGARRVAWIGATLAFAVIAGVLMAKALGSRGANEQITGSGAIPDSAVEKCRAIQFNKTKEITKCWAAVLVDEPDNVEALTYQGWAMVRGGDVDAGSAKLRRVVDVDPKYPDVHVFLASVAKNAGDFTEAKQELDALYALNPSPAITSTLHQMKLDTAIAEGLLAPNVKACWTQESAALEKINEANAAAAGTPDEVLRPLIVELVLSLDCMDKILVTEPDNIDALVMQSFGLALLDDRSANRALTLLSHAIEVSPSNPDAHLMLSAVLSKLGRPKDALASLDAIGDGRISPLYALVDAEALRASIESDIAAASDEPTTTKVDR